MSRSSSSRSPVMSAIDSRSAASSPSASEASASAMRMRVSGVRSSCETLASSSFSARKSSVTRSAISSNARETSPSSSRFGRAARASRSPPPSARAALDKRRKGRVSERASSHEETPTTTRTTRITRVPLMGGGGWPWTMISMRPSRPSGRRSGATRHGSGLPSRDIPIGGKPGSNPGGPKFGPRGGQRGASFGALVATIVSSSAKRVIVACRSSRALRSTASSAAGSPAARATTPAVKRSSSS